MQTNPQPLPRHPAFKDITGQTMPSGVRVIHFLGRKQWLAVCPCGREFKAGGAGLLKGAILRCPECRSLSVKPETNTCTICNNTFPFTAEHFQVNCQMPFGMMVRCRSCTNRIAREDGRRREQELRLRILRHYSGGDPRCACCGETIMEFLAIDHINGGGKAERQVYKNSPTFYRSIIRRGFPADYQILCHNCNFAKGRYGQCPHKRQ